MTRPSLPHFVYVVRCADGTFYTGCARDPRAREKTHNDGRGARYTSSRRPVSLVYVEECDSLGAALRREHQVKRLTRARKEALMAGRPLRPHMACLLRGAGGTRPRRDAR